MSNSRYSVYFLGQNKPLESLIRYNKHPKVHYYQHNVCKYLKDQDYLIFISKILLGRLKMTVTGVRKTSAFLQPWPIVGIEFSTFWNSAYRRVNVMNILTIYRMVLKFGACSLR